MPAKKPAKAKPRSPQKILSPEELIAREEQIKNMTAGQDPVHGFKIEVPINTGCLDISGDYQSDGVIRIESPPAGVKIEEPPEGTSLDTLLSQQKVVPTVAEILEKHDISPIDELVRMYNEIDTNPDSPNCGNYVMAASERRSLMRELLKYVHPQLKSVEHTGQGGGNKVIVVLQMPDGTTNAKEIQAKGTPIDV